MILQRRNFHTAIRQNIGKHYGRTTSVGDNSATVTLNFRMHENSANGCQFLTVATTNYTSLTEKSIDSGIVCCQSASVRRSGTTTSGRTARLNGGNVASLVDERARMLEHLLRVANLFHIEHDYARTLNWVESVVKVFENILDTNLSRVSYCPYTIEFQTVGNTIFLDEHSSCTRTGDEINTMRVELRNWSIESTAIVAVEETCAVRTNQAAAYIVDIFNNLAFNLCAFFVLLAEPSRQDDETASLLGVCKNIDSVSAELSCNCKHSAVNFRQFLYRMVALYALNYIHLGINNIHLTFERT